MPLHIITGNTGFVGSNLVTYLNKRDKNMYYTNFIKTSLKETDNRIKIKKKQYSL